MSDLTQRLTALTRDLILIPSTDSRPAERSHCFRFLRNHLEAIPNIRIELPESGGYTSLVALPEGIDKPKILLCGHLDVIDHPDPDSFRSIIEDGRIIGPGAGDMKGADAIMLELFCRMHEQHPGISLGLAITSDEERGGEHGVRFLLEETGLRAGIVIIPDGGSLNDLVIEEKGIVHARVEGKGNSFHAARPWLGQNILRHLADRLSLLAQHFDDLRSADIFPEDHWYPTCSITRITTSNDTVNCIPEDASATLDLRFPPPETPEGMLVRVREILGPDLVVTEIVSADATHLAPDPEFAAITAEITGNPVKMVKASGGSDARFFRARDIPVLLSRPLVGKLHATEEWIDMASMETYYRICETFIRRRLGFLD